MWGVRRLVLSLLGFPTPCNYVRRGLHNPFKSGYVVLSEAKGEPLHKSWEDHRHNKSYQSRLFRGLARIFLSLNEKPLPRIGSLALDSRGVITLSNRPLTLYLQKLENDGIPSGIPRQRTYTSVEPYISDLLSFQDNKILCQPNAVHSQNDGEIQLAALTALRATMHRFIRTEYRDGPFFFTLTDLHRSNIFVDEQWNIRTIIDLEWACSQPVEMQLPPYWLTSKVVDGFKDSESVAELDTLLKEYFDIYEEEETARNGVLYQAPIMRHVWEAGSFWYFQAVKVPKGMYRVFNSNIQPLFNKEHCEESIFDQVFWWYWGISAEEIIKKKIRDKEDYIMQLNEAFGAAGQDKADQATAD
jgi:Phosphotransferase enzyme family